MDTPEHAIQFVYRLDIGASGPSMPSVTGFNLFSSPWRLAAHFGSLRRQLGWIGVVRTAAKLMTSSRFFFVILLEGTVAHHGWVTMGRCRYYPVESEAAVVGPVETVPSFRGRGLATAGLSGVMSVMAERGIRILYIDTADTNLPMQRVIEKCGFGKPISTYPRPENGL